MVAQTGSEVKAQQDPLEHRYNKDLDQNSLHTMRAFKAGDVITEFHALNTYAEPNMYTLQVSEGKHIDLGPAILSFTNHSCSPTVFFDTAAGKMIALTDLNPGDQLTFFYPSTEWDMGVPFSCLCGTSACIGKISGARHTAEEVLSRHKINEHIKRLRAQQQA